MYTTLKFIGTPLVSVTETPLRVYWDTLRGSLTTIVDKTPQGVFNKEPFFNCVNSLQGDLLVAKLSTILTGCC